MNGSIRVDLSMPMMHMVPPTSAQSFLMSAEALFSGAEALSTLNGVHPTACAFLASQALECTLKSYLAYGGITEQKLRKRPFGHDLERLWLEAASNGLGVDPLPPRWCVTLNTGHSGKHYFRYPMGLNGWGLPALVPMTADLKAVIQLVDQVSK